MAGKSEAQPFLSVGGKSRLQVPMVNIQSSGVYQHIFGLPSLIMREIGQLCNVSLPFSIHFFYFYGLSTEWQTKKEPSF